MSRKSMLADILQSTAHEASQETGTEPEKLAMANNVAKKPEERVLAGPVRTMGLALDRMENEAKALHEALAAGHTIIELDTDLIDGSFVRDRLDVELSENDNIVQSIAQNGQEVPILVRQHPDKPERFQVAYGHRRLAATRLLKRKVRAVVRPLTDAQLVVAQGIENTARKDLSYIERGLFAVSLEERGFTRDIIGQALSIDKGDLSKLISATHRIPDTVIRAIGAAPAAGRRRWQQLADHLADENAKRIAFDTLQSVEFKSLDTDARFLAILNVVTQNTKDKIAPDSRTWRSQDNSLSLEIKSSPKKIAIELDREKAGSFGEWITANMDLLYQQFQIASENKTGD